jgi:putative ABC transport system substrate-binding protein
LLLLVAALALPAALFAQQTLPVIGYLGAESPEVFATRLAAFRQGLGEVNYAEGRNVAIEYRWAEGDNARLPQLAGELVGRKVSVIVAPGSIAAALAAKKATSTIPIVFLTGLDPVASGLVHSMNRPGGNATGITSLTSEMGPKRLQLLRELVPTPSSTTCRSRRTRSACSSRWCAPPTSRTSRRSSRTSRASASALW